MQQLVIALILAAPFLLPPAAGAASKGIGGGPQRQQPADVLKLTLLGAGEGGNACLDGSPFGYYIARNSSSRDWVIDIAGGGWCTSAAQCLQRIDGASSNRLASSRGWGPAQPGSGITSASVTDNPAFASYNRVFFPYCDGSSFTSHREKPLPTPNGSRSALLHMRGADNLRAAMASLRDLHGMQHVRHLIVTGGSAGGTSTFLHTDLLGQLAGAEDVVGMPDAGAFRVLPGADQPSSHSTSTGAAAAVAPPCCAWSDIVQLHNSTGYLNAKCVAAQEASAAAAASASTAWKCFTAPTLLDGGYISSPLFVLQSQFDHFQLSAMAHIQCSEKQAYFPPWKNVTCSAADNKTIAAYGAGWKRDFAILLKKPPVAAASAVPAAASAAAAGQASGGGLAPRALFLTACVAHEQRGTAGWTSLRAGGAVLRDAFAAFHRACHQPPSGGGGGAAACASARKLYLDDTAMPTNPDRHVCAPLAASASAPTRRHQMLVTDEQVVSDRGGAVVQLGPVSKSPANPLLSEDRIWEGS